MAKVIGCVYGDILDALMIDRSMGPHLVTNAKKDRKIKVCFITLYSSIVSNSFILSSKTSKQMSLQMKMLLRTCTIGLKKRGKLAQKNMNNPTTTRLRISAAALPFFNVVSVFLIFPNLKARLLAY